MILSAAHCIAIPSPVSQQLIAPASSVPVPYAAAAAGVNYAKPYGAMLSPPGSREADEMQSFESSLQHFPSTVNSKDTLQSSQQQQLQLQQQRKTFTFKIISEASVSSSSALDDLSLSHFSNPLLFSSIDLSKETQIIHDISLSYKYYVDIKRGGDDSLNVLICVGDTLSSQDVAFAFLRKFWEEIAKGNMNQGNLRGFLISFSKTASAITTTTTTASTSEVNRTVPPSPILVGQIQTLTNKQTSGNTSSSGLSTTSSSSSSTSSSSASGSVSSNSNPKPYGQTLLETAVMPQRSSIRPPAPTLPIRKISKSASDPLSFESGISISSISTKSQVGDHSLVTAIPLSPKNNNEDQLPNQKSGYMQNDNQTNLPVKIPDFSSILPPSQTASLSLQLSKPPPSPRSNSISQKETNVQVGLLFPIEFNDTGSLTSKFDSSSLLSKISEIRKKEMAEGMEQVETLNDALSLCIAMEPFLSKIPLPCTFSSVSLDQAVKDIKRENLIVNGQRIVAETEEEFHNQILPLLTSFTFDPEAQKKASQDILRACSRTASGGDAYFVISTLFSKPGLVVFPGKEEVAPISVTVESSGSATFITESRFDLKWIPGDNDDMTIRSPAPSISSASSGTPKNSTTRISLSNTDFAREKYRQARIANREYEKRRHRQLARQRQRMLDIQNQKAGNTGDSNSTLSSSSSLVATTNAAANPISIPRHIAAGNKYLTDLEERIFEMGVGNAKATRTDENAQQRENSEGSEQEGTDDLLLLKLSVVIEEKLDFIGGRSSRVLRVRVPILEEGVKSIIISNCKSAAFNTVYRLFCYKLGAPAFRSSNGHTLSVERLPDGEDYWILGKVPVIYYAQVRTFVAASAANHRMGLLGLPISGESWESFAGEPSQPNIEFFSDNAMTAIKNIPTSVKSQNPAPGLYPTTHKLPYPASHPSNHVDEDNLPSNVLKLRAPMISNDHKRRNRNHRHQLSMVSSATDSGRSRMSSVTSSGIDANTSESDDDKESTSDEEQASHSSEDDDDDGDEDGSDDE